MEHVPRMSDSIQNATSVASLEDTKERSAAGTASTKSVGRPSSKSVCLPRLGTHICMLLIGSVILLTIPRKRPCDHCKDPACKGQCQGGGGGCVESFWLAIFDIR